MFSLRKLWLYVRTVSGDNEYEIYLENFSSCKSIKKIFRYLGQNTLNQS